MLSFAMSLRATCTRRTAAMAAAKLLEVQAAEKHTANGQLTVFAAQLIVG